MIVSYRWLRVVSECPASVHGAWIPQPRILLSEPHARSTFEAVKLELPFIHTEATSHFETDEIAAYNACRLIPLDKNSGVKPIGVGEVLRRIIGKSILRCFSNDLKLLSQRDQLCIGQKCGALRHQFETPQAKAMLLTDAENVFNRHEKLWNNLPVSH